MLTQAFLKESLHYSPETGVFTWLDRPPHHFKSQRDHKSFNTRLAGKPAGATKNSGYTIIRIGRAQLQAHKLAFLYMDGVLPRVVDHINHVASDNRWANLRIVTHIENCRNQTMHINNKSGITGVHWHADGGKWRAAIMWQGKDIKLGDYSDLRLAVAARRAGEILCGYHQNHGKKIAAPIRALGTELDEVLAASQ